MTKKILEKVKKKQMNKEKKNFNLNYMKKNKTKNL